MRLCPIAYIPCGEGLYSAAGLRVLSTQLKSLELFNYSAEEQRREAFNRAAKMSIQGVQPKISTVLNVRQGKFDIVDKGGKYIVKPQNPIFPGLPENEDLTMRLAAAAGLETPVHGLILSRDQSYSYFIKRFDRKGHKDKVPVEDFAQLAGLNRDTKYNYSMEKVVSLLDSYCTFPAIEKVKLFKLTLFNFLTGNEDMHVKNLSLISRDGIITLSPCYDLVNSSIAIRNPEEEIALPLQGRKKKLNRDILIGYFGKERCGLTARSMDNVLQAIYQAIPVWENLISISFLSAEMKGKYRTLLLSRLNILKINS